MSSAMVPSQSHDDTRLVRLKAKFKIQRRDLPGERLGHSSVATTAAIYSHAIRGKDRAAAQVWDDLMQQPRGERPGGMN
jgi:integrase